MEYERLIREQDYLQSRADEYVWRRAKDLGVSRRRFFQILAAAGAAAGLSHRLSPKAWAQAAATPVIKPTPKELFNDFGSNTEMRWDNLYERGWHAVETRRHRSGGMDRGAAHRGSRSRRDQEERERRDARGPG